MQVAPSTRFAESLSYGYTVTCKIEVWSAPPSGQLLFSSALPTEPNNTLDLYIVDGSVTYDKTQDCRSQCSVKFVTPNGTYIPRLATDLFTPWGNELRVYWGLTYEDGSQEFVLMGVFRIGKVAIDETQGAPTLTITGYDRSRNISRNVVLNVWPDTLQLGLSLWASSENNVQGSFANLIQVIALDRWPAVEFYQGATVADWNALQIPPYTGLNGLGAGFGAGDAALPQSFSQGTDMWSQARQYAEAVSCDLFFTRDGFLRFYQDPSFINMGTLVPVPVTSFIEGKTAMFDKVSRTLDDSAAYNGVLVWGEGNVDISTNLVSQFPVGSLPVPGGTPAIDNDPVSPTNWNGPYGHVPQVITNNLLVTQPQCDNYAVLMLTLAIGAQESVTIPSSAVNPLIDVDDVIQIVRVRDGIPDPNSLYILSTITTPLVAKGQQSITVRQKRSLTFS